MQANEGKSLEIKTSTGTYERYAVKTHFVGIGENYCDLFEKYVLPLYREGDIVSSSEKVIALCQKRVVKRDEIKISVLAKLLSRFADRKNHGGYGVGMPINMQYAIDKCGAIKVIYASVAAGFGKLMGKKGVFYEIVGREVSGLDGFYDGSWDEYRDLGVEIPAEPDKVCNEIKEKFGMSVMIVDANDLGQEMLGKSSDITLTDEQLLEIIKDNPAGQGRECTPFIIVRKKS